MNEITYIITISSKRSSDTNMYRMISDTPLTRSWIKDRMYDHKYNPDLDTISIELLTDIPEIC